jgi:putative heme-binding domain-containing protein
LPNAEIAAGFENVVLTRKDGATVTGVLKSETADALVLDTPEDGRVTVKKSDLTKRERGPSAMIEGLGELMTRQELRDVVAALAE